ncbi:ATP-binding cassette domain-containing protein [Stratiformator vulcanicus]|uniref:UvrABC system protein A n=1 Tax=Stratiformator vulcanicus TaxID=2527980 RepID=A0A517R2W1_9PLAN|nr:ATP-binding cassette domain-containing protein [Stratiformator vulcanicus]QDT38191.1 UvrABC system protein A [Stratiformator vulcanicus]
MPEPSDVIRVIGARTRNLQDIDCVIPIGGITTICGVSGAGKTSLAIHTLHAEATARYAAGIAQGMAVQRGTVERPDVDSIAPICPSVAVKADLTFSTGDKTLAELARIDELLRELFARLGTVIDPATGQPLVRSTPETVADAVTHANDGRRVIIAFPLHVIAENSRDLKLMPVLLRRGGFRRVIIAGRTMSIDEVNWGDTADFDGALVVVDRLKSDSKIWQRAADSAGLALSAGAGVCIALTETDEGSPLADEALTNFNGRKWAQRVFTEELISPVSGVRYEEPEESLFRSDSPLGACPFCGGRGQVSEIDWGRLVPDETISLRDDAIVELKTNRRSDLRRSLFKYAEQIGVDLDRPFREVAVKDRNKLLEGDRRFDGLAEALRSRGAARRRGTAPIYPKRLSKSIPCPECHGTRLGPAARAVRLQDMSFPELTAKCAKELNDWLSSVHSEHRDAMAQFEQLSDRTNLLKELRLEAIPLNRSVRDLSTGEVRRAQFATISAADQSNLLYVIDEPTRGLGCDDVQRIVQCLRRLTGQGNTVVLAANDPMVQSESDHVIELGPAAGRDGGRVISEGPPGPKGGIENTIENVILKKAESRSADDSKYLSINGHQARGREFPSLKLRLNAITAICGPSGSGKSTLLQAVIHPAVEARLSNDRSGENGRDIASVEQSSGPSVDEIRLLTTENIRYVRRQVVVTAIKAFDEIRRLFAESQEAKVRGFTPSTFSFFNSEGGRCESCRGTGVMKVDMLFMPDVSASCQDCGGSRYRTDVLDIRYQAKSIADILEMTVAEAFVVLRNHPGILKKLNPLREVGLDYLTLGRSIETLSTGERGRLNLAEMLGGAKGRHALLLLDDPTGDLHPADSRRVVEAVERLCTVGHTAVVATHDPIMIAAASQVISLTG